MPALAELYDRAVTTWHSPFAIRLKDWRAIAVRAFQRVLGDNDRPLAAGIAFYAFLSVFPAVAAALMIWGLFTDMASLGPQLQSVREFAPDALASSRIRWSYIATQDDGGLTFGLIVSVILALWSASGGVSALMQAMNMAYHERRSGLHQAHPLTLGLHPLRHRLCRLFRSPRSPPCRPSSKRSISAPSSRRSSARPLADDDRAVHGGLRHDLSHRPVARPARWRWIIPGALAAAESGSSPRSPSRAYLENFNAYNATFGSLGAVAALLMWFWLSAYAICLGAELNSQLELFTTATRPSRRLPQPGKRGAYVADHIEEPAEASRTHATGTRWLQSRNAWNE